MLPKHLLSLFAFILFSITTFAQQTINGIIDFDNIEREYILYVPASYNPDTPAPLLFCFHGFGSTAAINMAYSNFKQIANEEGFILVHPQGTLLDGTSHWNVGGWTIGSTVDDIGFTNALLDSLSNAYNINADRVYSTGMSNGGYMSFLLACQLSDKFAAVASVTGSMTIQTFDECKPQHPTPILQIHGTDDGTVPYNGNPAWTKSINQVLEYWVTENNCEFIPEQIEIEDINTSDSSTVEHFIYGDGDNGSTVEHFKVTGGDHDWPGAFGNLDINASQEVWKFLSRYDLNGFIGENVGLDDIANENNSSINTYPNPTSAFITIENNEVNAQNFEIISTLGKSVMSGKIESSKKTIDISSLPNNIYFIKIGNSTSRVLKIL